MWKNDEIFRKAIETAKNHNARAEEGRKLLNEKRSLSEMKTPLTGLNFDETNERRKEYISFIGGLGNVELNKLRVNVLNLLEKRYQDENKGTSELEWQRIVIEDECVKRKLKI